MKVAGIYLAASRSMGAGASEGSLNSLNRNRTGAGSAGAAMLGELGRCGLDPLIVVVRADDPLRWLPPAGEDGGSRRVETCLTAHLGLSFSLRCGLNAVSPLQPDAVVVASADQPFFSAELVRRLIRTYKQHPELDYVAGSPEGARQPALFARPLFTGLQELDEEEGIAAIIGSAEYKGIRLEEGAASASIGAELPGSFGEPSRQRHVR
ncbi:NTP transferase domain-containing protein [Paenibacillus piscarius]|uniref:NTP transferase domain-containing protein n=1 Tax=Paenibacillus piscarius TaxID=1089681 RepID=UPI001EE83E74|nr:NTP transferase domain-containing protein [Paenibacillus piscarius]